VDITSNLTVQDGGGLRTCNATVTLVSCNIWDNYPDDYTDYYLGVIDVIGVDGNVSADPEYIDASALDSTAWDLHLSPSSLLMDGGATLLSDPDGSRSDIGAYGGPEAGLWDLDGDGYPLWWQPGPYDPATYPALGWDCDDHDADVHPGSGC